TIPENPPWVPDDKRVLEAPFPLAKWLTKHRAEIQQEGSKRLFDNTFQSDIIVYGKGESDIKFADAETWIWQLEGESSAVIGDTTLKLKAQDSVLISKNTPYKLIRKEESITASVVMDPGNKERGFAHLKKKE
ncbi:hypothetical protein SK128_009618, partial [Halocaridina rubra]